MTGEAAIRVEDLAKAYRLGAINHGMLYRDLQSWWARLWGREDPNARIADGAPIDADPARIEGDRFLALDGVSFEVKQGEILGIIGRNGAGKSTLLKVLSRVTAPTRGCIKLRGRVTSLLEVGTGFHPELTGRENIFLNGAILGMQRAEILRNIDEIIAFAEIGKFIDTPVKRYSSGMYVRLAFAVAAHLESEILVVDEVLAVGDYRFQRKCMSKMDEVRKHGRTILFVSHNMGAIRRLCSRVLLIKNGKLVRDGHPETVISDYLQDAGVQSATVAFPVDQSKDIHVSKVTLLDASGRPSTHLDLQQPFRIEVEYTVHREVSGVVVSCAIHTQLDECLLATADHDVDRARLGSRGVGTHRTSVTIPGHLINSGTFSIVIGISIPGKYIYDRREALVFELHDAGSFVVDGGGEERRNALLLLPLRWE
jgi:lipopolysaccharide transport system ATP-binding protein